jgi:hypothetical protein
VRKRAGLGLAAITVGTLLTAAAPAHAAEMRPAAPPYSDSCSAFGGCGTGVVDAHGSHQIGYSTGVSSGGATFHIVDVNTGVTVKSGDVLAGYGQSGVVGGLYGSYRADISCAIWATCNISINGY